jgi:hypothetical protein
MTYTITQYSRPGMGTLTAAASTTTNCSYARGFRNVAVGATIVSNSLTRTVSSKTDEDTIVASSSWTLSANTWTYTNPGLVLTGIYSIKHTKNDKPTATPIPTRDSDKVVALMGQGVIRDITVSGWIQSATIGDVYNNISILEGLADGSQTRNGTCIFTEDVPPRSSYVYITSLNWRYSRERPNWLDVTINMIECANRGS